MLGRTTKARPSAPRSEPTGMTRWPPYRSISSPTRGETSPAVSSASEKPPMAKVIDQPRSAAISGTVSTGG